MRHKQEKFDKKIFFRYVNIAIFVLGKFFWITQYILCVVKELKAVKIHTCQQLHRPHTLTLSETPDITSAYISFIPVKIHNL